MRFNLHGLFFCFRIQYDIISHCTPSLNEFKMKVQGSRRGGLLITMLNQENPIEDELRA